MDLRYYDRAWFAVHVRPHKEHMCAAILRNKGYEEFVPSLRVHSRSGNKQSYRLPRALFPGYLFCRFNTESKSHLVTTGGVIGIVGFGGTPCCVSEDEMMRIHSIVDSGVSATPCPFLAVGQRVELTDGPLRGVQGVLEETKKAHRLIVSINLLQRSVAVEVAQEWVTSARPL